MCGILGAWGNFDENTFQCALAKIAHRGPDGYGIYKTGDLSLGHRRLSILDLSEAGKQPMHYKHLTITFNGEIYNFVELRRELELHGHVFISGSDTEVLLAAYLQWGVSCLHKLNGQWAFAIWDNNKKELFLAKDRFGKKPLFYSYTGSCFLFASEMKAIVPFLKEIRPSKDFQWCFQNIMLYEATEKCLVEGIYRFPAGSYALLRRNSENLNPVKYWETLENLIDVSGNYKAQVNEFRELFLNACGIRMRSDVPIGTALSGGVDSSAILGAMVEISRENKIERTQQNGNKAFIACFKDSVIDEREYARQVVDFLNVPATYLEIDPIEGVNKLAHYLYLFEELYITSPIPMMDIYKSIRNNGVIVSIDGHGADELMGGYNNQVTSALVDAGLNFNRVRSVLSAYNGMNHENADAPKNAIPFLKQWYQQLILHIDGGRKRDVFRYFLKHALNLERKENPGKGKLGVYNKLLYSLYHQTVLPTLLRNYDRYSMANGVEIRMPFLDYRLVQYSFSLPWTSKIRNGYTKALIRDAARPFMPSSIVNRKYKVGFSTPIVEWMRGPWKEFFSDTMNSAPFKTSSLIDQQKVVAAMHHVMQHKDATWSDGEEAWRLITPYLWEQGFLKNANAN
ncbi:MAG: asparagine synthase (glutamine-hydrolyzing) [Bacteroidetes bacterium]|nr:asparagine synthase (glutamine-hydrolyzing) [Bacteroidota bacterium]